MAAIRSVHGRVFTQLVAEYRQKLVNALVEGVDAEYYRSVVGEIRGLDAALKLSEQADFTLSGDEPQ